ncbi:amidase signature domain-containing protein [Bombardia bombarda]|uniref:Amidase signature domain-containing protein n=1 Tax=Bombardia bombarda TaxID=252184 RepID=A0AA39XDA7_9PEZI|nr:amidase signature domain-containing protein [Bombardia bombarda]
METKTQLNVTHGRPVCITFSLPNGLYILHDKKRGHILDIKDEDLALASVFLLPQETPRSFELTADWVKAAVAGYLEDDVFDAAFLATVIFCQAEDSHVDLTSAAREYICKLGNQRVIFADLPDVLPGPYAIVGAQLRDVWKLIDDSYGTCMAALQPQSSPSDPFEPFQLLSSDGRFASFALQSKIKSRARFNSPLAGLRILLKDNIHLKGVRTSVGNRAFLETFFPRRESAVCIQKLVDQGVVVLGKTKLNSFGNWEEPLEYIDYQAPWNPRADGYQSPGGSSSGSAAAIAAYEWLDIAIGTDTWGSVTRPALWCGCFGLRPSIGAVSPNGIEPLCQAWDTAGVLARDLQMCRDFAAAWLDATVLEKNPKPFSSIVWPKDYWSIIDHTQVEIARTFAKSIEAALDITTEEISFEESWIKSPPAEANGPTLPAFINEASKAQCYDAYQNCEEFRTKYREKTGHAPYVSVPTQRMWEFARSISKEKRDDDFAKIAVFERWFNNTILTGQNSNALVLMPLESMTPRYRDEPPLFPRPPQPGVNALALAPVMKSPVLAVPIAEIPYHSRVTQQTEKLPFAVAVMGRPGTDIALVDTMLQVLKSAGLPTTVKAGKVMF